MTTDDSRYGIQLKGEPDNVRLGKRLNRDFQKVAPAIKKLSNEELMEFQEKGSIEIMGYMLSGEDIHVSNQLYCWAWSEDRDIFGFR